LAIIRLHLHERKNFGQQQIPAKIRTVPESPGSARKNTKVLATMTKNAAANLLRGGAMWVIVLFLPPLLVRVLDKPTYGVWLLLLQLAAYITVLDGGIQTAIARFVAHAEGLGDRNYMARLLSSAAMLLVVSGLATMLLAVLASWRLTDMFREIPVSIAQSARQALLVIGISLAGSLPFSVLAGFFLGLQKNEILAFSTGGGKVAGAIGTAWAAYHHQGLLAMAAWVGLGNIVQCLIYLAFWSGERKRGLLHTSYVEGQVARDFLIFCSAMLVSQFSSILIMGMDMPIVAAFDFRSVAYYGVAATLSCALVVPQFAIVNTLMPVAAEMSTSGDPQRLGSVLLKTLRFATALLCLITLPLLLLMPLFLHLWVGQDYAFHALLFAQILVVAQFVRLTMLPYAMIGFAAGQQQRMLASPIVEGAVNLVCSLALVKMIGACGVALGTLIGALVGVWMHFTVSLRRTDCVLVERGQLIRQGLLKPLLCALPLLLAALLAFRWLTSPLLQVPLAACVELTLLALFWKFSFESQDRQQLRELLGHFVSIPARLLPTPRT
jgi:O-antigen/teichoic acid export membrane protein